MTRRELIEKLKALNLTQTEIAQRLGVAQPSVSYWMAGERMPSWPVVRRIANVFPELASDAIEALLSCDEDDPRHPQ